MNVLIVTEYFPRSTDCAVRGGVEARSFYLAQELAARHAVHVICTREPGEPEQETVAGISVHRCGPARPYGQAGMLTARAAFLSPAIRIGRELKPDLVDGYNFLAYVAAFHISQALKIPRVATYHDVWLGDWIKNMGLLSGLAGELIERYVLSKSWHRIIANSEATRQKLLTVHARTPAIDVVYNGISLETCAGLRQAKAAAPTIAYVGRLVRYKRVDDLLRAANRIRQQLPDLRVRIVGSGPEESNLRSLTAQLGMEKQVEFLGFMAKHQEVLAVMAQSHLLCLPSAVEGFGMAIIEAMACGTPVVASALPPIREITHDGRGAALYPCGDLDALTNQLTALLTNTALRKQRTQEAITLAQEYDWKPLATKVETLYKKIYADEDSDGR